MDASQLKKLSESYATIAEGGKHEKSAMDWNKKDDNPEGKKVDKKKVDKCTCESFYLKRLKAMNPVMAEKYLAIAEIFIEEGYESSRLIDNLVEALPKEIVGEDFRAALHAVNPRIYENLDTAEKRQARATLSEFNLMQKLDDLRRRAGNFLQGKPSGSGGITPEIRRAQEYRDKGGVGVPPELRTNTAPRINTDTTPKDTTPKDTTPNASNYSAADAQRDQEAAKAQAQAARTGGSGGPTGSTAPARPTPTPAQTPKTTNRDGSNATRTAPNAAGLTPMQQWAKNFPTLAAKVKPGATGSKEIAALKNSHEPEGELVDEGSMKQARKNVGASTCWDGYKAKGTKKKNGRDVPNCVKEEETVDESLQKAVDNLTKKAQGGLERMGVKINRTERNTARPSAQTANTMRQNKATNEEVEAVDEGLKQARKNVGADTCWDGYKAKGTKKKNGREVPNCVKEEEITEKKKGLWDNIHAKRKRGEKPAKPGDKDYPKTLNVEGYDKPDEKLKTDRDGYRISDKEADAAKERIRKKTEEKRKKMNIRGNDSDEQKKRLEKKRGMKLDDHPQFKKEDYNVYDIILTYLDENDLMESVEEAEEIMMQLTGAQIVEIIDEFMNMDESMASAERMKELKKERLSNPAPSVKYPAKPAPYGGARSREFEQRLPKPENRRARSREFEHGSTRSPNTPSANLADKSPRNKDGSLMH